MNIVDYIHECSITGAAEQKSAPLWSMTAPEQIWLFRASKSEHLYLCQGIHDLFISIPDQSQ